MLVLVRNITRAPDSAQADGRARPFVYRASGRQTILQMHLLHIQRCRSTKLTFSFWFLHIQRADVPLFRANIHHIPLAGTIV